MSFTSLKAQGSKADSVSIVLQSKMPDSTKIATGIRLIEESQIKDRTKTDYYFGMLELYAKKAKPEWLLSQVYTKWANYWRVALSDYSGAFVYTNKRIKHSETTGDSIDLSLAYNFLGGAIYADLDLRDEIVAALHKSINYAQPGSYRKTTTYYYLGWMEFNMQLYNSALVHLQKSVEISKNEPNKNIVEFIGWVGNAYAGVKDYKNAILVRKKQWLFASRKKMKAV